MCLIFISLFFLGAPMAVVWEVGRVGSCASFPSPSCSLPFPSLLSCSGGVVLGKASASESRFATSFLEGRRRLAIPLGTV